MSSRQAKITAVAAALFAGIAGAEAFTFATVHQSVHLVIAVVAALIAIAIISATAVRARRQGNSTPPD